MLIAALAERSIRRAMAAKGIKVIHTLPEERPTPTWERITRIFTGHARYELTDAKRTVSIFHNQLSASQKQVLSLLGVAEAAFS